MTVSTAAAVAAVPSTNPLSGVLSVLHELVNGLSLDPATKSAFSATLAASANLITGANDVVEATPEIAGTVASNAVGVAVGAIPAVAPVANALGITPELESFIGGLVQNTVQSLVNVFEAHNAKTIAAVTSAIQNANSTNPNVGS